METNFLKSDYHLLVIRNMVNHVHFEQATPEYLVDRLQQMFPEYRAETLRPSLLELVSTLRQSPTPMTP